MFLSIICLNLRSIWDFEKEAEEMNRKIAEKQKS